MIEWPIYRNFSVFSQNSGYFDQNEKGVKKCPFPQSLRFCHNWWASGGVPGVRYAEELSALFYLHWESLWPGVCSAWIQNVLAAGPKSNIFTPCYDLQDFTIDRYLWSILTCFCFEHNLFDNPLNNMHLYGIWMLSMISLVSIFFPMSLLYYNLYVTGLKLNIFVSQKIFLFFIITVKNIFNKPAAANNYRWE